MIFMRIAGWANLLEAIVIWVMQTYLTNVWKLGVSHAAGIINVWNGLSFFLPIPFAFFADSFFGNFYTLLFSCFADTIGLGFLTLSTPHFLGSCKKGKPDECIGPGQKALFYIALALMAAGLSSRTVSQSQFFEEQKGEEEETTNSTTKKKEEICECGLGQKLSWRAMVVIIVLSSIVLPFIKSWSVRFGVPALCSLVALLLFLTGHFWQPYQNKGPQGSPLTTIVRVFVAAISKRSEKLPEDNINEKYHQQSDDHVDLTQSLRCLNKAAIILPTPTQDEQKKDEWHLCSVREVEDTKVCIKMAPLFITMILCGFVLSLGNTYFVEQANNLNQTLGRLKINVLIFYLFSGGASFISICIYNIAKKLSPKKYKKYFPLFGIAYALVAAILCCITAAKIETRRLKVIKAMLKANPPKKTKIPMSMFVLIPQYVLLGVFSGIAYTCYEELFKTRYPSSMDKYKEYFTLGLTGMGTAASYLLVHIVGKVSKRGGKPSWFQHSLNDCRLDNYYWTLAVIASLNLFLHIIISFILPEPRPKIKPESRIKKAKRKAKKLLCKCAKCVCICMYC